MRTLLITWMCLSIISALLRLFCLAFIENYPRIITYERWEDVLFTIVFIIWAFAIWVAL